MNANQVAFEPEDLSTDKKAGVDLNFQRVFRRAIRFWYLIVLSLLAALTIAYLINRYSTRVYPVSASILIKENEENVGAGLIYNNEILNPYRNFYNELYVLKSYPLIQEVIEDLGFDVSLFREGDLKTSEYYEPGFPVKFRFLSGKEDAYGESFHFTVENEKSYSMTPVDAGQQAKAPGINSFSDTIAVGDARLVVRRVSDISAIRGKTFLVRINNPLKMARNYAARLKAEWAQVGASVVNLEIKGSNAEKEIAFINKFIERYQYSDIEKKNVVANMAINFLEEQLLSIGDSLNLYEDQVENFKRQNITTNITEQTARLYQQVETFEEQKMQYRLLDNYFDYIEDLLNKDKYDGIFTPASVGITDPVIATLISQLIDARVQVNLYRSNASSGVERFQDNPRLITAQKKIEQLKSDILKTIENTRRTQKINVNFINGQVKQIEQQLGELPKTERELINIQRNYSLKESLYVILLQKRTEALLSKASTTSDIVVVNPPYAREAISPRVDQNYVVGGAIGLLLPLLVIVILELLNNKVQSKEDIEKVTSVPIIGGVGHNNVADPVIVYKKPRSSMSEAFRSLRANLNYFTGNKDHQIFMVTSSVPGEGKSFTTLNLASVFALAGKKTIIIGADLRRPKLFEELELHNEKGLSQYLSEMADLESILQKTKIENLYLITAGPIPPNPSELLLKVEMGRLLETLRAQFDFIIMDTPPLALVTDAFILSSHSDHTLFVVRQDYTPKSALRALDEFYESNRLTRVSILFNDVRKTGMGYGYEYNYGYGYAYRRTSKHPGQSAGYYQD